MEAWLEDLNPVEKSVTQKPHAQICHGHTVPPALVWSLHKNIRSHNLRISWFWRDPRDISLASGNYSPKAVLKGKEWEIILSGEALTLLPWTSFLQTFAASRWYKITFMMRGTRSGDWHWWGGLAKDMEMGSGWWVGVCGEENKRKNWGGQKCVATSAEFSKETHL